MTAPSPCACGHDKSDHWVKSTACVSGPSCPCMKFQPAPEQPDRVCAWCEYDDATGEPISLCNDHNRAGDYEQPGKVSDSRDPSRVSAPSAPAGVGGGEQPPASGTLHCPGCGIAQRGPGTIHRQGCRFQKQPPASERMSEEEFTRLEGDPETYGERFVAEARRARESETSWLAAHNRAVKAFNDTNAEKDDWRRTALKAEADLAREKERADSLDRQLVLATAAIVTIGRERNALAERVKKLEKSVEFYKACNERRKASGNTDHPTETRKQLRDQRDALAARVGRYEKALREIAEHPTVTENCMGVYDIDVAKRIAARALAGTPAAEGVADKEGGA